MDNRTDQIREGAGLDESRINQDFIDMLQKWSTPALFLIAAVVLAYWGWGYLKDRENAKINEAYAEVAGSVDYTVQNPSPTTLAAIRAEYGDVGAIGPMTALREADVYLEAAIKGVAPGSELELDENNELTGTYAEEDLLSEEEAASYLERAEGLYREVATSEKGGEAWAIHRLGGWFGLAAVAESQGDAEGAKAAYESAKALATEAGFMIWAQIADERLATVGEMVTPVKLVSQSQLPELPEPEVPAETETPEVEAGPAGPELPTEEVIEEGDPSEPTEETTEDEAEPAPADDAMAPPSDEAPAPADDETPSDDGNG